MAVAVKIIDKDIGWVELFRRLKQIQTARVRVGVLDDAKGKEVDPESGLTVAEYGAINEYGTADGRIPERSYLRSTFDEQREKLASLGKLLMGKVLDGKITISQALNVLGGQLAGDVKNKISGGVQPPNAPSTLMKKARKGKTKKYFKRPARNLGEALAQVGVLAAVKPLIDDGKLLGAITWEIVEGSL